MRHRRLWQSMFAGMLCACLSPPVVADEPTGATDPNDLERLRALLDAQQREINSLREQMNVSFDQNTEAERTELMRKQIREILSEREFRESLMSSTTSAGYDGGFYIRSSDDNFMMKFNGLLQFRWTHYATRSENRYLQPRLQRDDRTGFDVQRARFRISGNAYDPNLTYAIEFKADAPQGGDFVFDSGWIDYRFADEFHFMAGQFGLGSTHTSQVGGSYRQFVDYGVTDAVYNLGASVGVRFWGQLFSKRLDYYLDVANSTSDSGNTALGNTISTDPAELDSNPALLFRTVWHALGDNPGKDFLNEADLEFHESPALDLGFHYAFNDDRDNPAFGTTRIPLSRLRPYGVPGGFGLVSTNGLQFNQLGLDSQFKLRGFSLSSEYVVRVVDPRRASFDSFPYSAWYIASGDRSTTAQHGAYVQAGYFLPIPGLEKKIEAVARIGGISALSERQEGTWEYAAGVNYYINGNNVKLQMDVTKISEVPITSSYNSYANVNDDALIFRVQLSLLF